MPQGRTRSRLDLSQRKERAFSLFHRGWRNADVARDLQVTPDTAKRYRDEYEATLAQQAQDNPRLLINVLENTVRAITELDELRIETWRAYESTDAGPTREMIRKALITINDQRAKLFGLFGVKQEYILHVQQIQAMQNRLIDWMRNHLCQQDRDALEAFITGELAEFMGGPSIPALPVGEEAPIDA
jgi:hypothetical protein